MIRERCCLREDASAEGEHDTQCDPVASANDHAELTKNALHAILVEPIFLETDAWICS